MVYERSVMEQLISAVLLVITACTQPRAARCPPGMYLDAGVRTSGAFRCGYDFPNPDTETAPPGHYYGRIHCTNGTRPIIVSHRIVGCQR